MQPRRQEVRAGSLGLLLEHLGHVYDKFREPIIRLLSCGAKRSLVGTEEEFPTNCRLGQFIQRRFTNHDYCTWRHTQDRTHGSVARQGV